jgi:hypothetical protein
MRLTSIHQHAKNFARSTGDLPDCTGLEFEPADHALGRSGGGLSTKIHSLINGRDRPLIMLVVPG